MRSAPWPQPRQQRTARQGGDQAQRRRRRMEPVNGERGTGRARQHHHRHLAGGALLRLADPAGGAADQQVDRPRQAGGVAQVGTSDHDHDGVGPRRLACGQELPGITSHLVLAAPRHGIVDPGTDDHGVSVHTGKRRDLLLGDLPDGGAACAPGEQPHAAAEQALQLCADLVGQPRLQPTTPPPRSRPRRLPSRCRPEPHRRSRQPDQRTAIPDQETPMTQGSQPREGNQTSKEGGR